MADSFFDWITQNPVSQAVGSVLDTYNREVNDRVFAGTMYQAARAGAFAPFGSEATRQAVIRAFEAAGDQAAIEEYIRREGMTRYLATSLIADPLNLVPVLKVPKLLGMAGKAGRVADVAYQGAKAADWAISRPVVLPLKAGLRVARGAVGMGADPMNALTASVRRRAANMGELVSLGVPKGAVPEFLAWREGAKQAARRDPNFRFSPEDLPHLQYLARAWEMAGQDVPASLAREIRRLSSPGVVPPPPGGQATRSPLGGLKATIQEAAGASPGQVRTDVATDIGGYGALGLAPAIGMGQALDQEEDPLAGGAKGLGAGLLALGALFGLPKLAPAAARAVKAQGEIPKKTVNLFHMTTSPWPGAEVDPAMMGKRIPASEVEIKKRMPEYPNQSSWYMPPDERWADLGITPNRMVEPRVYGPYVLRVSVPLERLARVDAFTTPEQLAELAKSGKYMGVYNPDIAEARLFEKVKAQPHGRLKPFDRKRPLKVSDLAGEDVYQTRYLEPGEAARLTPDDPRFPNLETWKRLEREGLATLDKSGFYAPKGLRGQKALAELISRGQMRLQERVPYEWLGDEAAREFIDKVKVLGPEFARGERGPEFLMLAHILTRMSQQRAAKPYPSLLRSVNKVLGPGTGEALANKFGFDPQMGRHGPEVRPETAVSFIMNTADPQMMRALVALSRPDLFPEATRHADVAREALPALERLMAEFPDRAVKDTESILGIPYTRETGAQVNPTPWSETWKTKLDILLRSLRGEGIFGRLDPTSRAKETARLILEQAPSSGIGPTKTPFVNAMSVDPHAATIDSRMQQFGWGMKQPTGGLIPELQEAMHRQIERLPVADKEAYLKQWLPWAYFQGENVDYRPISRAYDEINSLVKAAEDLSSREGIGLLDAVERLAGEQASTLKAPALDMTPSRVRAGLALESPSWLYPGATRTTIEGVHPDVGAILNQAGFSSKDIENLSAGRGYWEQAASPAAETDLDMVLTGPLQAAKWAIASMAKKHGQQEALAIVYSPQGKQFVHSLDIEAGLPTWLGPELEQALIDTGIGGFHLANYGKGRGALVSATQYMDPAEHLLRMDEVRRVLADPRWGIRLAPGGVKVERADIISMSLHPREGSQTYDEVIRSGPGRYPGVDPGVPQGDPRGFDPEVYRGRVGAGPLTPGGDPALGQTGSPLDNQAPRRFYHGTASDWEVAQPSPQGRYGPGFYMSSDPRIAAAYADMRAKQAGGAGQAIKPVDVPSNLRLLNVEEPVTREMAEAIDRAMDEEFGEQGLHRMTSWLDSSIELDGQAPSVDELYNRVFQVATYQAMIRPKGDFSAETATSRILSRAGYDGILHPGGKVSPLLDEQGRPIIHDNLVVFPESKSKTINPLTGAAFAAAPVGMMPTDEEDDKRYPFLAALGLGGLAMAARGRGFPAHMPLRNINKGAEVPRGTQMWRGMLSRADRGPVQAAKIVEDLVKRAGITTPVKVYKGTSGSRPAILVDISGQKIDAAEALLRAAAAELGDYEAVMFREASSPANSIMKIHLDRIRGPERGRAYEAISKILAKDEYKDFRWVGQREAGYPVFKVALGIDHASGMNLPPKSPARADRLKLAARLHQEISAAVKDARLTRAGGDVRLLRSDNARPGLPAIPAGPAIPGGAGGPAGPVNGPGSPERLDLGFLTALPVEPARLRDLDALGAEYRRLATRLAKERKRAQDIYRKAGRSVDLADVSGLDPADIRFLENAQKAWGKEFFDGDVGRLIMNRHEKDQARHMGIRNPSKLDNILTAWREQALMSVGYHVRNFTDAAFKNAVFHGVRPWTGHARIKRMQTAWGQVDSLGEPLVPDEVKQTWADYASDTRPSMKRESKWERVPVSTRTMGGAAIGAMGGAAAGPDEDIDAGTGLVGAAAGAMFGRHLPRLSRLNMSLAQAIEEGVRGAAWLAGKQRHVQDSLPGFLKTVEARGLDASRMRAARGMFSPADVKAWTGDSELARTWKGIIADADTKGIELSNHIHFDYGDVTKADALLKKTMAFHFWATRNIPFYIEHLAELPQLAAVLVRYNQLSEEARSEQGLTGRFVQKLPMGELGDVITNYLFGMEGTSWANVANYIGIMSQLPRESYDEDARGELLEQLSRAGLGPNPIVQAGLRTVGIGADQPQSDVFRMSGPLGAVLGQMRGEPVNLEQPLRNLVGGFDMDDYALRKRLAEMSVEETGVPGGPAYISAITSQGPVRERADEQLARQKLIAQLLSFVGAPPMTVLPDVEAQARLARKDIPASDMTSPYGRDRFFRSYRQAAQANPLTRTYSDFFESDKARSDAEALSAKEKEQAILDAFRQASEEERRRMWQDPEVQYVVTKAMTSAVSRIR